MATVEKVTVTLTKQEAAFVWNAVRVRIWGEDFMRKNGDKEAIEFLDMDAGQCVRIGYAVMDKVQEEPEGDDRQRDGQQNDDRPDERIGQAQQKGRHGQRAGAGKLDAVKDEAGNP